MFKCKYISIFTFSLVINYLKYGLVYSFVHLCILVYVLFLHVIYIYINTFLVYIIMFLLFTCMIRYIFKHIHFEGLKLNCAYDDLHAYDINCYSICKPLIITSITINAIKSCVI
jgi:hypothetical protein